MSKKARDLTETEIQFISEQSGLDDSIVKSWYKGNNFYLI